MFSCAFKIITSQEYITSFSGHMKLDFKTEQHIILKIVHS